MTGILIYLATGALFTLTMNIASDYLTSRGLLDVDDSICFTVPVILTMILCWPAAMILVVMGAVSRHDDNDWPDNWAY